MSNYAVSWVYDQDLPKSEKFVAVTIGDFASPSGVAFPGWRKLAQMCGCDEATIVRIMKKLEATTVIGRAERRRDNGRRASDWIVLAPNRSPEERKPMRAAGDQEQYPAAVIALLTSPGVLQGDVSLHSEPGSPDILNGVHLAKSGGLIDRGEPPEEPPDGTTTPVAPGGGIQYRTGEPRREGFERRKREAGKHPAARITAGLEAEWVGVLTRLSELVDETAFAWLRPLRPVSTGEQLTVSAPARSVSYVRQRFSAILAAAASKPVLIIEPEAEAA